MLSVSDLFRRDLTVFLEKSPRFLQIAVMTMVKKTIDSMGNVRADPMDANLFRRTSSPSSVCTKRDRERRKYRRNVGLNPNISSTSAKLTRSEASERSMVEIIPSLDPDKANRWLWC
jgi:hypothetical protein